MSKKIQLPNGTIIEAPDDATDEEMDAIATEAFGSSQTVDQERRGIAAPTEDKTLLGGALEGFMKPIDGAAAYLDKGLKGIGVDLDAAGQAIGLPSREESQASRKPFFAGQDTTASKIGNFVGETAGTMALTRGMGGPVTQGALGGALLSDKTDAAGIAMDAGLGAVGGKVGDAAARGVAGVIAPQVGRMSDSLRTLVQSGVKVTPGQAARGMEGGGKVTRFMRDRIANAEDKNTSLPIVGEMIRGDRNNTLRQFEAATIKRALDPIGAALPANMSGRPALKRAGDILGAKYEEVLPRIGTFTPDQQYIDDLLAIQDMAKDMLPARAEQLKNMLGGLNRFFGNGGQTLDGKGLKAIEARLGDRIRRLSRSTDADQLDLAEALEAARAAVRDAAGRAHPDVAADLSNLNRGYAGLVQVERAMLNSKGAVTPAGYSQAVQMGDASTRRRGYARGDALNQDLADAASDLLPSQVADSGTAGRWAEANALGLLAGVGKAGSYAAQRAYTANATRPTTPQQRLLADFLRKTAPASGAAGTVALSQLGRQ